MLLYAWSQRVAAEWRHNPKTGRKIGRYGLTAPLAIYESEVHNF
jgi:hypothetical protein